MGFYIEYICSLQSNLKSEICRNAAPSGQSKIFKRHAGYFLHCSP